MLKKVAENIYQTQIPLPENPLRYINVYIIKGEDKTLVVDTGFNRPECEAALMEALGELGVQKADLFITHLHSDHCGLISKYGDQGWTIYAGETDGELMNFEAGNLYWRMLDDLFIKFGFPKADFGRNTDIHPGRTWCHPHPVKFTYVNDGDVLEYGGYKFRVIETPGHTPGHMCLYDEANRRLICGDHILGLITPNHHRAELGESSAGLSGEPRQGGCAGGGRTADHPRHPCGRHASAHCGTVPSS